MNTKLYKAVISKETEMDAIIRELVSRIRNLQTPVDDWMKNDEEYSEEIRTIKMLIAAGALIMDAMMGFDNYLQLGFPVMCSILNHALDEEGIDGEFRMSDDISRPWISYYNETLNQNEIGIECSFLTIGELAEYLERYQKYQRTNNNACLS